MYLKAYSERTALNKANKLNRGNPTDIKSVIEIVNIPNASSEIGKTYNTLDKSLTTEQKENIKQLFYSIVNKQCEIHEDYDVYGTNALISKDDLLEEINNL